MIGVMCQVGVCQLTDYFQFVQAIRIDRELQITNQTLCKPDFKPRPLYVNSPPPLLPSFIATPVNLIQRLIEVDYSLLIIVTSIHFRQWNAINISSC